MDHATEPGRAPRIEFRPDRRATVASGAGALLGVALAVVSLLNGDRVGALFGVLIVLVLSGYVVADLVFSPRLVVTAAGLFVRAPTGRAELAWADVDEVRADTRLRLGLRSTTLEIDAGATLIVLSRRVLGADPSEVADLANAFRPT